jgi:ATP-binding cassette, subfamily B, bacterial
MGRIEHRRKNPDELRKYSLVRQFKDSWKYSIGFRKTLVFAMVLAVLSGLLAIFPSVLYGKIVEDLTNSQFGLITFYLILLAGSYVLFHLFDRLIDHVMYIGNIKARNATRIRLYNFLFGLDFEFFEKNASGSIMNKINDGVNDFTKFNKNFYRKFLISLFSFIFAFVAIIYFDPLILGIGAATILVYLIWARLVDYKKIKLEYETSLEKDKEQAKIHDYLGHIFLVKLLNIKEGLIGEMHKAQKKILIKERIARNFMNKVVFVQKNLLDLSYVLILFVLAKGVIAGNMNIGLAVTVYALYTKFISEFKNVRITYQDLLNTRPGMFKLSQMWENESKIREPENPKKVKRWDKIEFDDVSFKYNGKEKNVLQNVSFSVEKGEKLAIVGLSGSGKSTISKLLFRMYLPDEGHIKIGESKISEIHSKDLYNLMKIVPQENELINATVYENLKFGTSRKVSREEVIDSLRKSHSADFVKKMPKKINTLVGPNGIKLSGGEKQRIAIARALLSKPEVLVLDEATAHLDVLTEKKIHDSIHKLDRNQTVIAITHRISSMYLFDRILVLDKGRIVGEGTHSKLLKTNSHYQKLWRQSKKLR